MSVRKIKVDLDYLKPGASFIYPLYSADNEKICDERVLLTPEIISGIKERHGNLVYYTDIGKRAAIPGYRMKIAYNVSKEILDEIGFSDKISRTSYKSAETLVEDLISDITSTETEAVDLLKNLKSYDDYLYNHSVNVGILTAVFANAVGSFSDEEMKYFTLGAFLHDIGSQRIDKQLLDKEGQLDISEMQKVKRHPQLGYEMLKNISRTTPITLQSVLFHHEKYNNHGYYELPYENLPKYPKMISICDMYDALTSCRPFRKKPMAADQAIKTLLNSMNVHFEHELITEFINLMGPLLCTTNNLFSMNEICELNTQELALVRGVDGNRMLQPKVLVFCKFLRQRSNLSVQFYKNVLDVDLEKDSQRKLVKVINNQAQINSIQERLKEKHLI
ncbi:MAG TPA: HD domain-containing protein [Spirochaetota bacterium]|nr:HD domain-containing protein [Spirochaetota bacterium]HQO01661.1 HD domain-containing protein [Spirochaetota bacterium]HQP49310.1 HD domain-containing protein [Spirochaetota bacterium]